MSRIACAHLPGEFINVESNMLGQLRMLLGFGRHESRNNRPRKRSAICFEALEDRSLLTAMANLTAYRPVTEYIDYLSHPVSEAVETSPTSGPGIRINGDDDNRDGVADYNDSAPLAAADNDLVRVDVNAVGASSVVSWSGNLAVWTSPTKLGRIANGAAVDSGQPLWVEYVT